VHNLRDKLNYLGKKKEKILFIFDFKLQKPLIFKLKDVPDNILFNINGFQNYSNISRKINNKKLKYIPENFFSYEKKFNRVIEEIQKGNSYLLNLTSKTLITSKLSLEDIFHSANSQFKILFNNSNLYDKSFVSFSPERFIQINNNQIFTYPMKGTIDSSIEDSKDILLNNKKELAEHIMIVDLLRNDLGIIGRNIAVEKFRYLDLINTNTKSLYQVSSKIKADLKNNWQDNLGDILLSLLPAGSITGTPKKSTVDIIEDIEDYDRGFFTGVFGYFDGQSLDSSVMIRFIEKDNNQFFYKSGGGITIDSNAKDEYQEMIDKIYLST
jgi:para-aminobenzoate synthetase component 1